MFKGVLGGFLTGTILSGLVLVAASVLTPIPRQGAPEAAAVDVPPGSEFKQGREDTRAALPSTDAAPEAEAAPRVALPEPDDLRSLASADTAPAEPPRAELAEPSLSAPEAQGDTAGLAASGSEPVLPSPQARAPAAPEAESGPAVSTEPAEPAPAVAAPEPAPEPAAGIETASAPTPGDETAISLEPAQPPLPAIEEESGLRRPAGQPASATPQPPAQAGEAAGAPQAQTAEEPAPESVEEPAKVIGDLAPGVTTGRLPTVAPRAAGEAPPPPLERFAVPFENPEGKPLMAIILIDDGQSPITHMALADFPYPLNFAVDAAWPGATAAAAKYRASGFEVLAMVDLPEGAGAADVEVAMQAHLAAVPEAVAVMEGTKTGLQVSREAIQQLIPILRESGHGLVLFSKGLDTAQKLIAREGIPVATVFRDFDGKGQNATVIRRFLDQAAFRATQEKRGVIMVGRLRAETVSALLLWGLQDRASSVALAPVSAVLKSTIAR